MMQKIIVLCLIQAVLVKEIIGCTNAEKTADGTKTKTCWTNDQCSDDHNCVAHLMLCCPILQLPKAVETDNLPKTAPEPIEACKNPETDINGLKKACSETDMTCSKNYICKMGNCCPVKPRLISASVMTRSGSCPSEENMPLCLCFVFQHHTSNNQKWFLSISREHACRFMFCISAPVTTRSGSCPSVENMPVAPVTTSSGSCPSVENMPVGLCFDIQDSIRCETDQDCQGKQLCCRSGCGSVCTNPEKPLSICQIHLRMAALQLFTKKDVCSAIFLPR
ncbi:WFDC2 [Mytilus coruscus]|uniref:WFDC2 n=1 Tax=Mytilus coruscus TaxID=42192 RepID=A0A6J8ACT4_MYTCO|nr:WFDC2 [Mytilus coruscus]